MNYTTIEQSKKLLELGLSPETADMFYSRRPTGKSDYSVFPDFKPEGRLEVFTKVDLPCWSLGALLSLMPKKIQEVKNHDVQLILGYIENKCSICYFDWTGLQHGPNFTDDSPLTVAYTMAIWLLENGYIKTEKK